MKQAKSILLFLTICLITPNIFAEQRITPFFQIRSQGVNAARHLVGWTNYINKSDQEDLYGAIAVTTEYTQSFDSKSIAQCLFGSCNKIKITGSRVTDRGKNDWLADYFYLPTDFQSSISFKPKIDNFIIDFNFFIGLDRWYKGLYFALYAPLVHSRWDLNFDECVIKPGILDHDPGYFNADSIGIARQNLLNSFTEYANGLSLMDTDTTNMVIFQGLRNAKISTKRRIRTRFSDVRMNFGWNCLQRDDYQIGIYLQTAAPTSNKPEGTYLFESLTGTHNWELGGGVRGFYKYSKNENMHASIHCEATITHLFAKRQTRTFDLQNKPFSRYMLAEKMQSTVTNNLKGDVDGTPEPPSAQFAQEFAPVANLSTVNIDGSFDVQADILLMLNLTYNNWSFDLGTSFWARTCEKLSRMTITEPLRNKNWALKGDAYVFGFMSAADAPLADDQAIPLSATMSKAVITHGDNFGPDGVVYNSAAESAGKQNPNIDAPKAATAGTSNTPLNTEPTGMAAGDQINTSVNPIVINPDDIDLVGTHGMSAKLFGHISYSWSEHDGWIPYLGFGGEAEWGFDGDTENCTNNCNTCIKCSLSQWGIWCKGGITFD